ncbi:hypothetical protein [Nonomuraea jiangxiensis]|uniref:Uncharacterized protein n=1 Tax=Nonomuraea jiangxiensis TaxID=633440 RepID=A0A1G8WUE7_9ACTN|nr:hypothetical protein [Nonomuraea jiangxiensis]SDJ81687.1 hypothetical protein SAMN05421869_112266 [Nonomuraea jiangxiensis]
MALFEVQMRTASFLAAQLRGVQSRRNCLPPPFPIGGFQIQVQRIEFGANSIRHNVPSEFYVYYREPRLNPDPPHFFPTPNRATGFKTQIVQPVTLHLVESNSVLANPNASPPAVIPPISFSAVLTLSYDPVPFEGCKLFTRFDHIEPGQLPALPPGVNEDQLWEMIIEFAKNSFQVPPQEFNFTGGLLPTSVTWIANAGVSVNHSLDRISFRVDPFGGTDASDIRWTNFYSGALEDRVGAADWGLFLDARMLESKLTRDVEVALQSAPTAPFRPNSIGSRYFVAGGVPCVDVTVSGVVEIPLLPDVDVAPTVHFSFSTQTTPPRLVADVRLDEIQKLLDFPARLLGTIKSFAPPLGYVLELAIGDDVRGIAGKLGGIDVSPDGMECTMLTPTHRRCTIEPPAPDLGDLRMRLSGCVGQPDGMVISGEMLTSTGHRLDGGLTASQPSFESSEFAWIGPKVSCSQASNHLLDDVRRNPDGYASLYAEVAINHTGTTPVYVCEVQVINDRLGVFPHSAPGLQLLRDLAPTKIKIKMPMPDSPEYNADPYPLDLLVKTSAGVQLIRIPAPKPMTDADRALVVGSVDVQLRACPAIWEWVHEAKEGKFDLAWIVDPLIDPPYEMQLGHFWDVRITGLIGDATVTLFDQKGDHLLTAQRQPSSTLRLHALVPPAEGTELTMLKQGEGSVENAGVEISQQVISSTSLIPLPNEALRLIPATIWSRAGIVALMDGKVAAFDMSNPHAPSRVGVWSEPGLTAVCPWEGRLFLFGARGMTSIGSDLVRTPVEPASGETVLGAAAGDSVVYLLTSNGVDVRAGSDLHKINWWPFEGGQSILRTRDRLFVGGKRGLASYRLSDESKPELEAVDERTIVADLAASDDGTIAMLDDGSAIEVTVIDRKFRELTKYGSIPPWAHAVWLARTVALLDASHRWIAVGVAGDSRLEVPMQKKD